MWPSSCAAVLGVPEPVSCVIPSETVLLHIVPAKAIPIVDPARSIPLHLRRERMKRGRERERERELPIEGGHCILIKVRLT